MEGKWGEMGENWGNKEKWGGTRGNPHHHNPYPRRKDGNHTKSSFFLPTHISGCTLHHVVGQWIHSSYGADNRGGEGGWFQKKLCQNPLNVSANPPFHPPTTICVAKVQRTPGQGGLVLPPREGAVCVAKTQRTPGQGASFYHPERGWQTCRITKCKNSSMPQFLNADPSRSFEGGEV